MARSMCGGAAAAAAAGGGGGADPVDPNFATRTFDEAVAAGATGAITVVICYLAWITTAMRSII
jgi:hypothetical protein